MYAIEYSTWLYSLISFSDVFLIIYLGRKQLIHKLIEAI